MRYITDLKSIKRDKVYVTLWKGPLYLEPYSEQDEHLGMAYVPFGDGYKKISYWGIGDSGCIDRKVSMHYVSIQQLFGVVNSICVGNTYTINNIK